MVPKPMVFLFLSLISNSVILSQQQALLTPANIGRATLDVLYNTLTTASPKAVTFHCMTQNSPTFQPVVINDPNFHSKVDTSKKFGIVTHGWLGSVKDGYLHTIYKDWMLNVGQVMLNKGYSTVCAVDYENLSYREYFTLVTSYLKIVVETLTKFLIYLKQQGVSYGDMTLVGHSLGAQISGMVGAQLNGSIGSIFGLDPAGPGFTFLKQLPVVPNINKSNAQYVQIIHTNAGQLGNTINSGHADFWVNGGSDQNGCTRSSSTLFGIPLGFICDHLRPIDYFLESAVSTNICVGTICSDYRRFEAGGCSTGGKDRLGLWTTRVNGAMYLDTNSQTPFCRG